MLPAQQEQRWIDHWSACNATTQPFSEQQQQPGGLPPNVHLSTSQSLEQTSDEPEISKPAHRFNIRNLKSAKLHGVCKERTAPKVVKTSTDADHSSNEAVAVDGNADRAEVACEVVVEADAVELIEEPVSRAESDAFFELYDTDGSGAVEMEELLEMVASFKQVDSGTLNQAKIKQVWDADGDGTVRCVGVLCEVVE